MNLGSKLNIFLLDKEDKAKNELNLIKPKTYESLLKEIRNNFGNLSEYYKIFIMDNDIQKKIKINNDDDYKMVKDILFIIEIDEENIIKSIFDLNFNKLSESNKIY